MWLRTILTSLLALTLVACAPMIPARDFQVAREWRDAQVRLANRTAHLSYEIPPTVVRWAWTNHIFKCGEHMAIGCFDVGQPKGPIITIYEPASMFVIEHEACHAILFLTGDPEWGCHCHDLYGGGENCEELKKRKATEKANGNTEAKCYPDESFVVSDVTATQ